MKIRILAVLLLGLPLAACSSYREAKISESFQMNYDEVVPTKIASPDGAIYSRSQAGFFLGDRRAQRVGDVLTIELNEIMSASKSNDAAMTSSGTIAATLPKALFGAGAINIPAVRPGALSSSSETDFSGSGGANQSNRITGKVTVVVTRVYENGHLWVQGQKSLTLNQGDEYVRVEGLVRPEDILPGNIVRSDRIAQAKISYTGAGAIHDVSKQGWFGRFFNLVSPL